MLKEKKHLMYISHLIKFPQGANCKFNRITHIIIGFAYKPFVYLQTTDGNLPDDLNELAIDVISSSDTDRGTMFSLG